MVQKLLREDGHPIAEEVYSLEAADCKMKVRLDVRHLDS